MPTALAPRTDALRLSPPVQAALLAVAHRRMLAQGDSLFLKGSMPDALFGVVQGTLRVSVTGASGREAVIAVLQPGHWFGEVSLLVGQERVYDTFATEPTEMAVVSAPDFHRLIASSFEIHMAFTRLIGLRLRQALRWIDDAILSPLPVRLAQRILALAQLGSGEPLAVSQEDLAMMLGVSRQSVNRQLKLWEDAGLLRLEYKRIALRAPDALERLAQG
jgi:CRP/FNR family cyclic AMP-dependent transcriptional regulator